MSDLPVGSPLSMHDPPTVGPFSLTSRLGAGGMGVVYYGHSPDTGYAAVKVIRPGLLDAPATRDRFRREVAILRSVRDRHICQFLAADLESEPAWLAIEYISGPILRDQILEHGPLPEDEWWDLAQGLAQALAVLEVHRITHRDLKPGNVILNERGPVVIDFGIAHPEDATALTATGLVTGSPAWLSPEQANLEPTGPESDIFTLGSLLAFAATGRPPFGEGVSVAVLVAIANKEPDLAGIDPNRMALLRRMLSKDPRQRPKARQVLDRTRMIRAGRAVSPAKAAEASASDGMAPAAAAIDRPDSTLPDGITPPAELQSPTAVPEPAEPTPAAPAVPTGIVSGLPPEEPLSGPAPVPAPVPAASPPAPSGGGSKAPWILLALLVAALVAGGWWLLSDRTVDRGPGTSTSSSAPPSAPDAPAAPSGDQLRSGDWLLESYRLVNAGSDLSVTGTVRNNGTAAGSADLTVWVYLADGTSLGSVQTTVQDVPAGGTVQVTMTGDAVWKAGPKVVLLQAE